MWYSVNSEYLYTINKLGTLWLNYVRRVVHYDCCNPQHLLTERAVSVYLCLKYCTVHQCRRAEIFLGGSGSGILRSQLRLRSNGSAPAPGKKGRL